MGGKHAGTTTAGAWTARREGDPAVRLRGEFYRVLFRVLRDAVFITDGAGGFLDANPAARALSGYTLEELRELRLVEILSPEMPGRWLTEPVDHSLRCQDGARKLVELHVSMVVPDVYFYVLRDVTDLRRLEIRAAQSERVAATSHLLANVVHELNNHLTVVRGQATLLCQSSGDGPLAERARKIALAVERSLGSLEDLLALARQRPPEHLGEPSQVLSKVKHCYRLSQGAADQEGVDRHNQEAERPRDHARPTILYAEDNRDLRNHVRDLLAADYNVFLAGDGRDGLEQAKKYKPDLIISDQMMPQMSGRGLLRVIREDSELRSTPVIFLTARAGTDARIESLEAGADDYLAKPFHEAELRARIRTLLRARAQERELAELNRTLERRVQEQVAQLERLGRLKRFFSPQLAELIVAGGAEDPLKSHRREVTVVFLDLRGFTAFAETAEPEEVMGVLREYHAEMGKLILQFEGTLERFTGDGMMVFFNDPVPVPNPAERAIRMALAMRDQVANLSIEWRRRDYHLDFGVGLAQGHATIGAIGFEGRWDYGAIGAVTNLAARLCAEAKPGQILIPRRMPGAVEELVELEPVGELALKGFRRPVSAYNVLRLKE